ncbi:hypothetical protein N7486_005006 [Penicillium sp. IBT 16267x]|nr:hypothetical protein N7486_005006 [Penicillium sp. IBT 16267x]
MSDTRWAGPRQVEVATAVMTAIIAVIVGVFLDRWVTKSICNSPPNLGTELSPVSQEMESMRERLGNLETSFVALQAILVYPKPGGRVEKKKPSDTSGDGGGPSRSKST